ncbi:MAG TPA: MFS transporter [Candidatus Saccharimonadales bacterium]|nr:MFS transporter [Candidatus Saccharimonadales bacterium]
MPPGRITLRDQLLLSCFWLAYNFEWGALLPVVLPHQIAAIVGDSRKELMNGLVPALGAGLSLVATPIAGALSDRSTHPRGRRRPFLAAGTVINILFLLALARIAGPGGIGLFLLAWLGVQLGANVAGGPYAGLIPDIVPAEQRGAASGWLALMTAVGTLLGVVAAGALVGGGGYLPIYVLIASMLALFAGITVFGVKEQRLSAAPAPFRARAFLSSFLLRGPEYRDFFFVLFTRALVTMGIYSVFTFFQFFLHDIVRVPNAARATSYLIAIIIGLGIPTSLAAGALSDRVGRKPLVYLSGGVMALASLLFIGVGFHPSLHAMLWIGALFGIGYGAYQAVDWALAIDVLPPGESAAKDMGIWHVSLVLPQMLAPALTGAVLAALKPASLLLGYTVVFTLTALWFILGTVFVRQIRGAR